MIRLYQREDCSQSQRVRSRMTELGLSYVLLNVPRFPEDRDELLRVSGQSRTPVLVDDGRVLVAAESILAHLEGQYGGRQGRVYEGAGGATKTYADRPGYGMTRQLQGLTVGEARERVQAVLARHGFSVLAAVDLGATLRERAQCELGRPFVLLQVSRLDVLCGALAVEPYVALLGTVHVLLTAEGADAIVSIARPVAALAAVENSRVRELAERAEAVLVRVMSSL